MQCYWRATKKFASRVSLLGLRRCGKVWAVGILPTYGHLVLRLVAASVTISANPEVGTLVISVYYFGAKDKVVQGLTEAWCIAKIRRLSGPLDPPVNPDYEDEFLVAEHLESTTYEHPDTKLETQFIKVGTLRHELERLPGPKVSPELLDFIEYSVVVDHTRRPTALEAL